MINWALVDFISYIATAVYPPAACVSTSFVLKRTLSDEEIKWESITKVSWPSSRTLPTQVKGHVADPTLWLHKMYSMSVGLKATMWRLGETKHIVQVLMWNIK